MASEPDAVGEAESPSEVEHDETAATKLGVLLVHGIGTQRRGDVVLEVGNALHHWFSSYPDLDIELVAADISPEDSSSSGTPANAHMLLQDAGFGSTELLLAECHWAATLHAPSYRELVRWAWRVVPSAVLLHLVPRVRNAWWLMENIPEMTEQGGLGPQLAFEVCAGRPVRVDDNGKVSKTDLEWESLFAIGRLFKLAFLAMWLAFAGGVLLILLPALLLVSLLLPFEAVRNFARDVQIRLAATIGDSYLYLTNPLTASAILSKVDESLAWMVGQGCDQVIVLAHSQGAAIAYDAITGNRTRTGRNYERLTHLITYGSGLGKLFDLRAAQGHASAWKYLGILTFGFTFLQGYLAFLLFGATSSFLSGRTYLSAFEAVSVLLGMLALASLMVGLLGLASDKAAERPIPLDSLSVEWDDLYASHDSVPNGRIQLAGLLDQRDPLWFFALQFHVRQRKVTNRRSLLNDHTSYWRCEDDFVARVASRIVALATGRQDLLSTLWIELSAERRCWRTRIRKGFLAIAAFLALAAALAPAAIGGTGVQGLEIFGGRTISLLGQFSLEIPPVNLPTRLFRQLVMIGFLAVPFCLAAWGFKLWESSERALFFRGPDSSKNVDGVAGYRITRLAKWTMCAGWFGLVVSLPLAQALLDLDRADLRFHFVGPVVMALGASALVAWRAHKVPGTQDAWAMALLEAGEEYLASWKSDCQGLEFAREAFGRAKRYFLEHCEYEKSERAKRGLEGAERQLLDARRVSP